MLNAEQSLRVTKTEIILDFVEDLMKSKQAKSHVKEMEYCVNYARFVLNSANDNIQLVKLIR